MSGNPGLTHVLPGETLAAWKALAGRIPEPLYLVGGTAIAARLGHRESRDLDFLYHRQAVNLDALAGLLGGLGRFVVQQRAPGTLAGALDGTRIQVLHADERRPQHRLDAPEPLGGLRVAGMRDLVATKLQAVAGRAALRDYLDLMEIETRTGLAMEEGLGLWLARYRPDHEAAAVTHLVLALGSLEDVEADPTLPIAHSRIARYWESRQPALRSALSRRR